MSIFLSLLGIALSILMIKYRERVAEMIGSAEWMDKVGGVYNVIIIAGILLFFLCIASLTGTTGIFLSPIRWLLPGTSTVTTGI